MYGRLPAALIIHQARWGSAVLCPKVGTRQSGTLTGSVASITHSPCTSHICNTYSVPSRLQRTHRQHRNVFALHCVQVAVGSSAGEAAQGHLKLHSRPRPQVSSQMLPSTAAALMEPSEERLAE